MNIALILLIVDWLVFNYTFKYQWVTRDLSRKHTSVESPEYQMILSPTWLGIMGWLVNLLHICTAVAFFLVYGWIFAVLYLILSFFGYGLIDFIVPFPSRHYCLGLIKKSIRNDINKTDSVVQKIQLHRLRYIGNKSGMIAVNNCNYNIEKYRT